MGWRIGIGGLATVIAGMVVSTQNETAGGVVFLIGLLLTGIWVASA